MRLSLINLLIRTPRQYTASTYDSNQALGQIYGPLDLEFLLCPALYSSPPSVLPHICPSIIPMASGKALIPLYPILHYFGQQNERACGGLWENLGLLFFPV